MPIFNITTIEPLYWTGLTAIATWAAVLISAVLLWRVIRDARDRNVAEKDHSAPNFILKYVIMNAKAGQENDLAYNDGNFVLRLRNVGNGPAYDVKVFMTANNTNHAGHFEGHTNVFGPHRDEKTLLFHIENKTYQANELFQKFNDLHIRVEAVDMYQRCVVHEYHLGKYVNNHPTEVDKINPVVDVKFICRKIENK